MPWLTTGLALLAFVGVLVLMYPPVAAWWAQYNQSQLIGQVESSVDRTSPNTLQDTLDAASRYNSALTGGALVAPGARIPQSSGATAEGFDYQSLLRADAAGVMGRLRIPSIQVDLPIYHGTSDAILAKGVGHLEGTSLPVGGEDQHSVLTAHRGLAQATLFDDLDHVKIGDTFSIDVFGETLTYRVRETRVVLPEETEALYPQPGEDLVTLVTCTPLGINTHRILVTGERLLPTPQKDLAKAGAFPDIPGFPWWAPIIGGAAMLLAMVVWFSGRQRTATQASNEECTGDDTSTHV